MAHTHHKYKVLVLVKDRQTGDVYTYEKTYLSKMDMKRDISLKYHVKRLSLVTPELYQGVSLKFEVSVFVSYQY